MPEYGRWDIRLNDQPVHQCTETNPYDGYVVVYMHDGMRGDLPPDTLEMHKCTTCFQRACMQVLRGCVTLTDLKGLNYA